MKLSVIIVNYNVKYFLEQALSSVRKAAANITVEVEVFVVDNNSVDDSVQMVKQKFPEVRLIVNTQNLGFSAANNQAIQQAQGEYVLLLNPDTVVEEDTFQKCIEFMDNHPDAGGLGVKMIDGSGKFLPESKRGFPTPFVAFAKSFGLSKLFPKSKLFNHYHLGYLDKEQIHEVEVLAGAFLLIRKKVLNEIGMLDERFFMYGEDIDLSYRIVKAGYKNYYFPNTTIIHYKGESTKKGSLNYVKVFYNAMIIFAKKHFKGDQARLYILMVQMAIYLRGTLSLLGQMAKQLFLPMLDAVAIFAGMYFLKDFWAINYFQDPHYYKPSFMYFNVPLYILIWLGSVYFSGGYDDLGQLRRLLRGLLIGTLILAAVYGFLGMEFRTSRVLIVLGAVWAFLATIGIRTILHFVEYRDFAIGRPKNKNLVIVASKEESDRVRALLLQAEVRKNFIGTVSPTQTEDHDYLSNLNQLDEVVQIYNINEIIFCSRDVSAQKVIKWMTCLGADINYKIVPEESLSIIGSSSKNTSGELYTIDLQFRITKGIYRRNKRILDFFIAFLLLFLSPILIFIVEKRTGFLANIFQVILGKKTWVGYAEVKGKKNSDLPKIKNGILSPVDLFNTRKLDEPTIHRLNFFYAKDYTIDKDLEIIWKGIKKLGTYKVN